MFFNSPRYNILFLLLVILSISCRYKFIQLRIYAPKDSKTYLEDKKLTGLQIIDEQQKDDILAIHDPYLFRTRNLKNQYGSLKSILEKEIQNHPTKYQNIHSTPNTVIRIKEYKLETKDSCWSNLTYVEFQAEIQIGNSVESFQYNDKIESKITDCFLVGSTLTLIPLLVYMPYQGFRGNREDQINQLGRNSIDAFLFYLERKQYKPNYSYYNPKNSTESIQRDDDEAEKP